MEDIRTKEQEVIGAVETLAKLAALDLDGFGFFGYVLQERI